MDELQTESMIQPEPVQYPPKFQKPQDPGNIWLRSILSLALYLALGYYIFHSFAVLLLITAIVIFHELGHFAAMKIYRYKDLGIFFIPLLGAYVSGTKREVSQKESAVILLAGPLPGIIVGLALFYFGAEGQIGGIPLSNFAMLLIFLNLINLLPIYPLDGGQLLHRLFLDEESWLGKAFVFVSAAFLAWVAIRIAVFPLLIFPALMLMRLFSEKKMEAIEKKIEAEGISLDVSYEDLSDENYWKIRRILIEEQPAFRDQRPGPPFEYGPREEKLMTAIQGLLQRHLIQDMPLAGKLFVLLIWVAAIAAPWLLQMEMEYFRRMGF